MNTTERKTNRKSGYEVLGYFAAIITSKLQIIGLDEEKASSISIAVMDTMEHEFGGQLVYFPKNVKGKACDRNKLLLEKLERNEGNIGELAEEFGISQMRVYQIISEDRARRKKERQEARAAEHEKEVARWKRENY